MCSIMEFNNITNEQVTPSTRQLITPFREKLSPENWTNYHIYSQQYLEYYSYFQDEYNKADSISLDNLLNKMDSLETNALELIENLHIGKNNQSLFDDSELVPLLHNFLPNISVLKFRVKKQKLVKQKEEREERDKKILDKLEAEFKELKDNFSKLQENPMSINACKMAIMELYDKVGYSFEGIDDNFPLKLLINEFIKNNRITNPFNEGRPKWDILAEEFIPDKLAGLDSISYHNVIKKMEDLSMKFNKSFEEDHFRRTSISDKQAFYYNSIININHKFDAEKRLVEKLKEERELRDDLIRKRIEFDLDTLICKFDTNEFSYEFETALDKMETKIKIELGDLGYQDNYQEHFVELRQK